MDDLAQMPPQLAEWVRVQGLGACLWSGAEAVGAVETPEGVFFAGDIPLRPVLTVEDEGAAHVFHVGCNRASLPEQRACFWLEQVIPPSEPPLTETNQTRQ